MAIQFFLINFFGHVGISLNFLNCVSSIDPTEKGLSAFTRAA